MLTISLTLTPAGSKKLNNAAQYTNLVTRDSLKSGVEVLTRPAIVEAAPSKKEEETLTSIGESEIGTVGVGGPGRFEKNGFKWIKEAIAEETVNIQSKKGIIWGRFGQPKRINPKIGFTWLARDPKTSRTDPPVRRTTADAGAGEVWKRLIEAWEYGSGPFIVKSRDPKSDLYPQKDTYVKSMTKSIGPWKMFQKGYNKSKVKLGKFLDRSIRGQVRAKFGQ